MRAFLLSLFALVCISIGIAIGGLFIWPGNKAYVSIATWPMGNIKEIYEVKAGDTLYFTEYLMTRRFWKDWLASDTLPIQMTDLVRRPE